MSEHEQDDWQPWQVTGRLRALLINRQTRRDAVQVPDSLYDGGAAGPTGSSPTNVGSMGTGGKPQSKPKTMISDRSWSPSRTRGGVQDVCAGDGECCGTAEERCSDTDFSSCICALRATLELMRRANEPRQHPSALAARATGVWPHTVLIKDPPEVPRPEDQEGGRSTSGASTCVLCET